MMRVGEVQACPARIEVVSASVCVGGGGKHTVGGKAIEKGDSVWRRGKQKAERRQCVEKGETKCGERNLCLAVVVLFRLRANRHGSPGSQH